MVMQRRPNVGTALVALALMAAALTLVSCSRPDSHVYDGVNEVASSLGLSSIGETVYAGRYGTGKFSDDGPTLIWVVSGPGVKTQIEHALSNAGYTPNNAPQPVGKPVRWERVDQTDSHLVSVTELPAGATFQDADQKDRTVVADSVKVFIAN